MNYSQFYPNLRMQRLRGSQALRNLINSNSLTTNDLILPLFIHAGKNIKNPIHTMPGHFQFSVDALLPEIQAIQEFKIPGVILFGIPESKDAYGTSALNPNGVIMQAIDTIKNIAPELLILADCCFCEYTDHGHCGVLNETGNTIDNDKTIHLLGTQAAALSKAGADIIAPSAMMDGMVQAIRSALDESGFKHIPILSYAVKYASALYGPFREAAQGAPAFGDRKTYQMDFRRQDEALSEAQLDIYEGADALIVKPAGLYLDIIQNIKTNFKGIPLCAYQVSGEYAMIKAAAQHNWLNEEAVMLESLYAIKRAGADFIISYFAKEAAKLFI